MINHLNLHQVIQAFLSHIICILRKPLCVRTDASLEFTGKFVDLLLELKIKHTVTYPISPWTNRIVERMVRFVKSLHRKALVGRLKD